MNKGYMGKVLFVDLSKEKLWEEVIPDEIYENYIGGMGLASYILFNKIPACTDPLGPDNMIAFLPGLLTGTGSFFTGRWMVAAKSPLTNSWGDANCGGSFSPAIKRCGYDGIFFSGISERPVYLYIDHHVKELRDATKLWGKDAVETEEILIEDSGSPKTRVACIGPAGEKLSFISGISTDKGRMAARSGLGAVMGAKKLKAIVLSGKKRIKVHNKSEIQRLSKITNKYVQFQFPMSKTMLWGMGILMRWFPLVMAQDGMLFKMLLRKWGTASMNQLSPEIGDSPIKNWIGTSRDWGITKSYSTNPDKIIEKETVKYHCYSCPLGCGGICSFKGKYNKTHKPEYETVLALGGLCMNKDADSIFYLNELLNRAGMDTISAGAVVAFAIECYENGILDKKDLGGLDLSWGNSIAIIELIERMIKREGIGDLLADGVKIAASKIGRGADKYAIHAGGQELPMHDSRNDPGFALHYIVEPTAGRHTIGSWMYYEMFQLWKAVKYLPKALPIYMKGSKYKSDKEKAVMGAANSKFMCVVNSAGCCKFGMFLGTKRIRLFDLLNAATGWDKSPEEYIAIGGNIQTIKQSFNVKQGIEPGDIVLPGRTVGKPAQTKGANKGRVVDIEPVIKEYWNEFGWDIETGKPGPERMAEFISKKL